MEIEIESYISPRPAEGGEITKIEIPQTQATGPFDNASRMNWSRAVRRGVAIGVGIDCFAGAVALQVQEMVNGEGKVSDLAVSAVGVGWLCMREARRQRSSPTADLG